MPRKFNVPTFYRSLGIGAIKQHREEKDPKKHDLSPSVLDFGPVRFKIARHFGFCFGVENAIEIAYKTVEENPGKRIFLISEMIHNPDVNADLQSRGVSFLFDTCGNVITPLETLTKEDIVIVPAFGTTLELIESLQKRGIDPYVYDATCPFVEKVWKRADQLGKNGYSVIIHGKRIHEETRATFSHSITTAPTLVILDMSDAIFIADFIRGKSTVSQFKERFASSYSENFDPDIHLAKVGVINQTTMLATETKAIAKCIRDAFSEKYGEENLKEHFADTRDTLCYATYENQTATRALIDSGIDMAIIVGGYNSSNTSHLVELCEERVPTFYIKNASEILSAEKIRHFDLHKKEVVETAAWIPSHLTKPLTIALTSGASCPDKTVDEVLKKVTELVPNCRSYETTFEEFIANY